MLDQKPSATRRIPIVIATVAIGGLAGFAATALTAIATGRFGVTCSADIGILTSTMHETRYSVTTTAYRFTRSPLWRPRAGKTS